MLPDSSPPEQTLFAEEQISFSLPSPLQTFQHPTFGVTPFAELCTDGRFIGSLFDKLQQGGVLKCVYAHIERQRYQGIELALLQVPACRGIAYRPLRVREVFRKQAFRLGLRYRRTRYDIRTVVSVAYGVILLCLYGLVCLELQSFE